LPSPSSPEGGRCPFHLGRIETIAADVDFRTPITLNAPAVR
jgi:hypothetical protein